MKRLHVCLTLTLALLSLRGGVWPPARGAALDSSVPVESTAGALVFIENAGQFPDGARFQVRGRDLTLWLAKDAIWLTVMNPTPTASASLAGEGVNVKLTFPGANPQPRLEPFNRLDTHVSFFTGNDSTDWRADVPVWGGVRYADLYPGIDLELTGEQGRLVPRLVARPGAGLSAVRLRVEGADAVAVKGNALRLGTAAGDATWPLLRAEGMTTKVAIEPTSSLAFDAVASFTAAHPNRQSAIENPRSEIQDPRAPEDDPADLLYGTFLGGSSGDEGVSIAVDASEAAYVTGSTHSSGFPTTPGAFDPSYNGGYDAFVAKLNEDGSCLVYATFLGGNTGDDDGKGIAVDASGAAYIVGETWSSDFPSTLGAFDPSYNGYGDAFVAKLDENGSCLAYATFLGGNSNDFGYSIVADGSGVASITGETSSPGFPTTPAAFDTTYNGAYDAFVAKLNADGSDLTYATFLGASSSDRGLAIAVDGNGAAYVAGRTASSGFPTTPDGFDTSFNGGTYDAFVAKLDAAGSALDYATFLGGTYADDARGIAVDGSGAAYVTGLTDSPSFPITPGAFDTIHNGYSDAFVAKLNADGSDLAYATFLGGSGHEWGMGIAVDGSGTAYVTGPTQSSDFPSTPDAFDTTHNGYTDAFALRLNADGSCLAYATFLA